MFDDFLYNVYRSIRLDKSLYKDPKSFENLSLYYSALIMILCGIAGGLAKNSVIESYNLHFIQATSIYYSGLANLFPWILWSFLVYIIGVKIFPENEIRINFKKVLIIVGYAHAPILFRYFIFVPKLIIPIIFITELWFLLSLIIGVREVFNYRTKMKSFGIVLIVLLIISILGYFLMSQMSQQFN